MKTREDLLREFRRDTGKTVDIETVQLITPINYLWGLQQSFEEIAEQHPGYDKLPDSEKLSYVERQWDLKDKNVTEFQEKVRLQDKDLESLETFMEYVRWLEEQAL